MGSYVWDTFLRGGSFMWLVLFTFLLGAAYAVERLIGLDRRGHIPKDLDKDVVHVVDARGLDAGLSLCQEKPSSLSRVLRAALLRHGTGRQEMEAAVSDEGQRVLYDLRRNTRTIGVMAILAPLLGLLGACSGLIAALNQAAADCESGPISDYTLAVGLSATLLPAAFGLLVAILLCYSFFYLRGRAADIAREIDQLGKEVVIALDRKARQSIRLIEDIEEHIQTKDMPAVKGPPPDLAKELELTGREGSGVKTGITTPVNLPLARPPPDAGKKEIPP